MRIFFNQSEISRQLNKYKSDTYIMTMTGSDYIHIASDFPMNHFFIKMGSVVNNQTVTTNIDYWTGDNWESSVNVNDYTDGLSNSGFVEFTPNRNSSWGMESTNSDGQSVDGLENVTVYDKYWTRISFSGSLTPSIELSWLGNIFSDDTDLFSEFPIFNDAQFLVAFEAGKNSWEEQHVKAAELIIQDLKRKNIICGHGQILDRDIMLPASVSKCAEIIFNSFGNDYNDQKKSARLEYDKRMELSKYSVDINSDGILDHVEVTYKQGWLSR